MVSSFIYALTHHLVLDASLGYFISRYLLLRWDAFCKKNCRCSGHRRFSGLWPDFSNYHATAFPALALTMGHILRYMARREVYTLYDVMTSITVAYGHCLSHY